MVSTLISDNVKCVLRNYFLVWCYLIFFLIYLFFKFYYYY